jgi:hypothetical protein
VVWDLTYRDRADIEPPHVEDVIVSHGRRLDAVDDMRVEILRMSSRGAPGSTPSSTADSRRPERARRSSAASRLSPAEHGILDQLVSAGEIAASGTWATVLGSPEGEALTSVKYVGMESQIDVIPTGSLIRFSLARWAVFPPGVGDERCYLQVSGWFS